MREMLLGRLQGNKSILSAEEGTVSLNIEPLSGIGGHGGQRDSSGVCMGEPVMASGAIISRWPPTGLVDE